MNLQFLKRFWLVIKSKFSLLDLRLKDASDELEEQYDVDHMQNIITNFRLSFPVVESENLDSITTTQSPLPKFFIITWKYNPVSEDYDRELETDSPFLGDFLEDKEPSGLFYYQFRLLFTFFNFLRNCITFIWVAMSVL